MLCNAADCKLTCHKKCYAKVTMTCGKDQAARSSGAGGPRVFGVPLHQLAIGDGKVPIVVDRLITTIEMRGLYVEGLYRKSGVRALFGFGFHYCRHSESSRFSSKSRTI